MKQVKAGVLRLKIVFKLHLYKTIFMYLHIFDTYTVLQSYFGKHFLWETQGNNATAAPFS